MRLSPQTIDQIRTAFHDTFSSRETLRLFGSQLNPDARGGDLDFYIESIDDDPERLVTARHKFRIALYPIVGYRKIDVVLNLLPLKQQLPIYEVARREGVLISGEPQ